MKENLEKNLIEKEALLDYVNNKIATYIIEPSIYKYAYENSRAFRNFINNTSDEMKKYFNALKTEKRVRNLRKGLIGFAAATTIFALLPLLPEFQTLLKLKRSRILLEHPNLKIFLIF